MSTDFDDRLRAARDTLPTPGSTISATTEERVLTRFPAAIGESRRFRMPQRLVAVAAPVAAALLVGGFAGAELASPSRGATPTPVTSFQPALGWNTYETNVAADPTQPDIAVAANVPFKQESALTPINTIKNLPANGIVIMVVGPGATSETEGNLSLPPKLSNFSFFSDNYEGQWAPNVSNYHLSGLVGAKEDVGIEVWMGRNDPTPDMKAAADEELARLTLPATATTASTTTAGP